MIESNELALQKLEYKIVYESERSIQKYNPKERYTKKLDSQKYDYICTTYSQFSRMKLDSGFDYRGEPIEKGDKITKQVQIVNPKIEFLQNTCKSGDKKVIFVLDESHNTSTSTSCTGRVFGHLLSRQNPNVIGAVYLSATFAKRPENMWVYAMRTSLDECRLPPEMLTQVLEYGGVPMQEVVSEALVRSGQMVRRQRGFENIEVRYIKLDKSAIQYGIENTSLTDRAKADKITLALRDISNFENKHLPTILLAVKYHLAAEGVIRISANNTEGHVRCNPLFSRIFNFINQMQLAIKAETVAKRAIQHVKQGKKVIIAVAQTGESALNYLTGGGYAEKINGDYGALISRLLRGSIRFHGVDTYGKPFTEDYDKNGNFEALETIIENAPDAIQFAAQAAFRAFTKLDEELRTMELDLPLSPIDAMRRIIEEEGIKTAECTGRKTYIEYQGKGYKRAFVKERQKGDTSKVYNDFQNNLVDVMILNSSGATGQSAHAIPTELVPPEEVKQRVMIVAQAELDVAVEIQKRGRINRTGQIINPIYEYITTSIPAEERLLMMLKGKLKSLDANTSSDQRANDAQLDCVDIQNKYGDQVVAEWLAENADILDFLQIKPKQARAKKKKDEFNEIADYASMTLSRLPILTCAEQEKFFTEVFDKYNAYVEKLKEEDVYDLEVETLDYKANMVMSKLIYPATDSETGSIFSSSASQNTYECELKSRPLSFDLLQTKMVDENFDYDGWLEGANEFLRKQYDEQAEQIENRERLNSKDDDESSIEDAIRLKKVKLMTDLNLKFGRFQKVISGSGKNCFKRGAWYTDFTPLKTEENNRQIKAVCLGVFIKTPKTSNPYALSNVEVRFAVTHENSIVAYNLSSGTGRGWETLETLMRSSVSNIYDGIRDYRAYWVQSCKETETSKQLRTFIEGNLISAYAFRCGLGSRTRLIRFKDKDGNVHLAIQENITKGERDKKNKQSNMLPIPVSMGMKYALSYEGSFVISGSAGNGVLHVRRYGDECTFEILKSDGLANNVALNRKELDKFIGKHFEFVEKKSKRSKEDDDSEKQSKGGSWVATLDKQGDDMQGLIRLLASLQMNILIPPGLLNAADRAAIERDASAEVIWTPIKWDINNIPKEDNRPDVKGSKKLNAAAQLQLFKFKMAMAKAKEAERARRGLSGVSERRKVDKTDEITKFIAKGKRAGKKIVNIVMNNGHYDMYCDYYTRSNSIYSVPINNADAKTINCIINK